MANERQDVDGNPRGAANGTGANLLNKRVFAWAMYDWANSAYSTVLITVLVSYIKDDVFPGTRGTVVYGWGLGVSMLTAAFLSPILALLPMRTAASGAWLIGTALPGAVMCSLMYFATPQYPYFFLVLFLLANLLFELSFGFYNAFLPEISGDANMGRVSAWGYGLGYVGGGLALALEIVLLFKGKDWGISDDITYLKRLGLLFMGLWWGLFSIPTFLILRDTTPPSKARQPPLEAARSAIGEVYRSIRGVRKFPILALFLLGFLVYNDGVQTMISQSSTFAIDVLDMSASDLAMVVLMIQFIALPGSMLVGYLADRYSQKATLIGCLLVWIALLAGAFFITTKVQFWWLAGLAALVLGGTQSVSRSIMGLMTPAERSAEFFGFFNLSGRMASPFGPIFFSSILAMTGNANLAIASLLIFFVIGLIIVAPLNFAKGRGRPARRRKREAGGARLDAGRQFGNHVAAAENRDRPAGEVLEGDAARVDAEMAIKRH